MKYQAKNHTLQVELIDSQYGTKSPMMQVTPNNRDGNYRQTNSLIYRLAAEIELALPEKGYSVSVEVPNERLWIETVSGTKAQNDVALAVLNEVAARMGSEK